MKKQVVDLVRNYIRRLSDEDISFLYCRLRDKFEDDLPEAIKFIERSPEMDRWLSTSKSADDLYNMVDVIYQYLEQDARILAAKV